MENSTPKYPFSFFLITDINNFKVKGYEMFPDPVGDKQMPEKEISKAYQKFISDSTNRLKMDNGDYCCFRYDIDDYSMIYPHAILKDCCNLKRILLYIDNNNINPVAQTLLPFNKYDKLVSENINLKYELENVIPIVVPELLKSHKDSVAECEKIIRTLIQKFGSDIVYYFRDAVAIKALKQTKYYRTNRFRNIAGDMPDTMYIDPLQLILACHLLNNIFERYYNLYHLLNSGPNTSVHINLIREASKDDLLTEKQIELLAWRIPDPKIVLLIDYIQQTSYYRNIICNDEITTEPLPYHLLLADCKLQRSNVMIYRLRCGLQDRNNYKDYADFLRGEYLLERIEIQMRLLQFISKEKVLPFKYKQFLQRDLDIYQQEGRPEFEIIKKAKLYLTDGTAKNDIPNISSDSCITKIETKRLKNVDKVVQNLFSFLKTDQSDNVPESVLLNSIEGCTTEICTKIADLQNIFTDSKLGFYCSLEFQEISENNYDSFIRAFMAGLGYKNSPYMAFKTAPNIFEIVGINLITYRGKFHPIPSVLNNIKSKEILYEIEKKYMVADEKVVENIKQYIKSNTSNKEGVDKPYNIKP